MPALFPRHLAIVAWQLIIAFIALIIFSAAIVPAPAQAGLARLDQTDHCDRLANAPLKFLCPPGANSTSITTRILSYILALLLPPAAVIATFALVYGAVQFILSRGDEEGIRRAKSTIVYSILGLIIIGLAGWVINSFINAALFNFGVPPVI